MKHKWEKQPDENQAGLGIFKIWVCKVCGCKKELLNQKFAEPAYIRNQQIYFNYIECMDYDAEMLKTID